MATNKKKKRVRALKVPKSVQDSIPYTAVYPNHGLIETEPGHFTRIYSMMDCNFTAAKEAEQYDMFNRYGQLLNTFDASVHFQVVVNNHAIDKKNFEEEVLMKLQNDGLDDLRCEENAILSDMLMQGRNDLTCEKYLVVSVEAESAAAAMLQFTRLDTEIPSAVYQIGQAGCSALSTTEMLRVLYDIYNPDCTSDFGAKTQLDHNGNQVFDFGNMRRLGLTTKDIIAPASIEFRPHYFMLGDTYGRCEYLSEIPVYLNPSFYTELTNLGFSGIYSIQFAPIPQNRALQKVRNRLISVNANVVDAQKKAAKGNYSPDLISQDLKDELKEATEQLQDLSSRNQKIFEVTITMVHFAPSKEELDRQTEVIKSTARKHLVSIASMDYQMENGLNTTLPLCNNQVALKRTLTCDGCCVFMPFNAQDLNATGGYYYGANAITGNLITFERARAKNPAAFIFGIPGSGKSFLAKHEIMQTLLKTEDDILVLDPEREFFPLAAAINKKSGKKLARVEHIVQGTKKYINPLDISINDLDEDPMGNQLSYIISLCQQMYNSRFQLPQGSESLIDRAMHTIYQPYLQSCAAGHPDERLVPTLVDLMETLKEYGKVEPAAREISLSLETYATGSQDLFAHQTVRTAEDKDTRMIIYDVKDVSANLKSIAMLIIINQIWVKLNENRLKGKRTWIYLDEIYLLFNEANSAEFIKQLWKRSRKYNGQVTGLTQNVEDLLTNDTCRTMISNSEIIWMLSQSQIDRASLETMLNLSPTQLSFIKDAPCGCGLMKAGQVLVPFKNVYPKNTELFRLMNTNMSQMTEKDLEMLNEARESV